jgi:hypothetical protein
LGTADDLSAFVLELQEEAINRAQDELRQLRKSGNVDSRARALVDALLTGTIDEVVNAADRTALAFNAGNNVSAIPLRMNRDR